MCELPLQDGRTGRLDAVSSDTGADFNITDVRTVTHLLEAPCTRIDDDGVHHIATPGAAVSISLDIAGWKKTIKYHHPRNAIGLRFVPLIFSSGGAIGRPADAFLASLNSKVGERRRLDPRFPWTANSARAYARVRISLCMFRRIAARLRECLPPVRGGAPIFLAASGVSL